MAHGSSHRRRAVQLDGVVGDVRLTGDRRRGHRAATATASSSTASRRRQVTLTLVSSNASLRTDPRRRLRSTRATASAHRASVGRDRSSSRRPIRTTIVKPAGGVARRRQRAARVVVERSAGRRRVDVRRTAVEVDARRAPCPLTLLTTDAPLRLRSIATRPRDRTRRHRDRTGRFDAAAIFARRGDDRRSEARDLRHALRRGRRDRGAAKSARERL